MPSKSPTLFRGRSKFNNSTYGWAGHTGKGHTIFCTNKVKKLFGKCSDIFIAVVVTDDNFTPGVDGLHDATSVKELGSVKEVDGLSQFRPVHVKSFWEFESIQVLNLFHF